MKPIVVGVRLRRKFSTLKTFFITVLLILKYKPKVVFITKPWPDSATGSTLACACFRVKTIIRYALVEKIDKCNLFVKKILYWAKKRNQVWVALSKNNLQLLSLLYNVDPLEIKLIYDGYNPKKIGACFKDDSSIRSELGLAQDTVLLLTVASIDYRKGYDILFHVIPSIISHYPKVAFLWAGIGPLENHYYRIIKRMGFQKHIFLLGFRNDIPKLMRESDLFVFPSRAEGLSGSILEAIYYKLPIIAFSASSMPEIIDHYSSGLLAQEGSVEDFKCCIYHAIEYPEQMRFLQKRLVKNCWSLIMMI